MRSLSGPGAPMASPLCQGDSLFPPLVAQSRGRAREGDRGGFRVERCAYPIQLTPSPPFGYGSRRSRSGCRGSPSGGPR